MEQKKDYVFVNDYITYDETPKMGDEAGEPKTKKPTKSPKTQDSKFKTDYFAFYDDVKLTPKDDW